MTKPNHALYGGPERRRHARQPSVLPARIVMARDTLVFCQTRDLSEGGTCLRGPLRFRVDIGERLVLAGGNLGAGRDARVVGVSEGFLHCAFVV